MVKSKDRFKDVLDGFGKEILIKEYPDGVPVVSTGSLALDVSMGTGGVPAGRYTEIYGPESGGKTSISLNICKEALKSGLKVLYVEPENSLDYAYAKKILGEYYDETRMVIVQPQSAEDAFRLTDAGVNSDFNCIVFDSIASLSPEDELEEDNYGKVLVAKSSRLTTQFLRKTVYKVREKEIVFIFTNQVRAKIGSYVQGYDTPAGYALRHYTSLIIFLSKTKGIDEDGKQIGNYVNFVIKKNKIGVPYRQAQTNVIYGKGIDYHLDVVKFASMLGVLKSRGSYFAFEGETLGQGVQKTIETLEENKEVLDKIIESCYNIANVKYPPVYLQGKGQDDEEKSN